MSRKLAIVVAVMVVCLGAVPRCIRSAAIPIPGGLLRPR